MRLTELKRFLCKDSSREFIDNNFLRIVPPLTKNYARIPTIAAMRAIPAATTTAALTLKLGGLTPHASF
ncbi:MAG TPA: hypothetical protein VIP53_01385 [Nitrososphaera sp.]